MSKKIIHNKVPMFELTWEEVEGLHNSLQEGLGDEYKVITTSTDLTMLEGDDIIIRVEGVNYTTDEILKAVEIIKRGAQYL